MPDSNTIYIPLLNEGVDVWRPTKGINLGNNKYKVLATENYNPEIEEWKFPPDSIVECAFEVKEKGKILIAKRLASHS